MIIFNSLIFLRLVHLDVTFGLRISHSNWIDSCIRPDLKYNRNCWGIMLSPWENSVYHQRNRMFINFTFLFAGWMLVSVRKQTQMLAICRLCPTQYQRLEFCVELFWCQRFQAFSVNFSSIRLDPISTELFWEDSHS